MFAATRVASVLAPRPSRWVPRWRIASVDGARSDLVLQETALFIYQLRYDSSMQQAMLFDNFDAAQKLKTQRDEVDALLEKFQTSKGPKSGAAPLSTEFMDITTAGLNLRNDLNKAVEEERYDDAARIRDEIAKLNERAEARSDPGGPSPSSIQFKLGQIVKHKTLNYKGVVCGWDLGCCESETWRTRTSVESLPNGVDQPFYHILVDERDWPAYTKGPPMGYVAQESLEAVEDSSTNEFQKIRHPYMLTMFLGLDNRGSYIPCTPLRNKYKIERQDSYPPDQDA